MSATLKGKFPKLIGLLLVIALAVSLAKLIWSVVTPETQAVATTSTNKPTSVSQKKKVNYGKLIAAQSIFGKAPVKPKVVKKAPVKPKKVVKPKVKLNAKLHGIVAYRSQQGFALISNKNGPQKVYAENDTLQEGVVIKKVLGDKVLVDNNGTEEELLLPVKKDTKSSKQDLSSLPGFKKEKPASRSSRSNSTAEASAELPDLNQFRQEVLSNPAKLTDIVRASPAIIDGKFVGFRVRSGKNRKLFRQLNFRANDIITEVNGIVLDDQSKGLQVLATLEEATDLSVKVKRGTQEVFIDHSF